MNPASSLIEQLRSGSAPRNIKEFAAQGMLPIAEEELVPLQVQLSVDTDEPIAELAKKSLQKVSQETWFRLVEKKDPDHALIEYCLRATTHPVKEKILLNHSVGDDIFRSMASTESGPLLDIILNNQVRLLRDSQILLNLETNPYLTFDQKRRIEEFKEEFIYKKQQSATAVVEEEIKEEEIPLPILDDLLAQIPNLDIAAQKLIQEITANPPPPPTEEQIESQLQSIFSTDELEKISEETLTTYQRIMRMSHPEKIRVALLGNKEERTLLIRDPSRQIASLVIKNPKLTDSEMDNFASMRNLDSEILREMAGSRTFIKRYNVIITLVKNPKVPSASALNLLKLLRDMDLRNVEHDRNIPEIIRRQAKKIRAQREISKDRR
ncbi:MAG TPA: hypothetical protein VLH08_04200 [Acidobacteriota bacterium]|nr:hypothetical protein [Acidobacteriota bacterium]